MLRRADVGSSTILSMRRPHDGPLLPDTYTGAKSRDSNPRAERARRAASAALCLALVVVVFIAWDLVPLGGLRGAVCGSAVRTGATADDMVVLDRFAESAADRLRRSEWRDLTTLVMVAGHAIFTGVNWGDDALRDESNWILESFQKGQVDTYLRHIERGIQLAANDSSSLLLFSGGQTRSTAGPRSEGLTYWLAADAEKWYGHTDSGVQNRTLSEEYARDSLENLLFSVCRFKQVTGRYPHVIKVVSFGFKEVRFVDVHRRALRFPAHRFEFHGVDPEGVNGMRGLTAGERANAMGPFAGDPYGCNTRVLSSKKEDRNPNLRYFPYPQGCPELSQLFQHCGRQVYSGPLPWDRRVHTHVNDRH